MTSSYWENRRKIEEKEKEEEKKQKSQTKLSEGDQKKNV